MNRESKQSKKFCELALKALPPGTARKDVRAIYKTIKHEKNETYKYLGAAMAALEKKVKLDMSIQSYNNIINDTTKFTIREVQNAKSHLARLIFSNETTSLITEIETAFKLERGSLMPKTAMNAHLVPKKKKRSRSVSHNRPHGLSLCFTSIYIHGVVYTAPFIL